MIIVIQIRLPVLVIAGYKGFRSDVDSFFAAYVAHNWHYYPGDFKIRSLLSKGRLRRHI